MCVFQHGVSVACFLSLKFTSEVLINIVSLNSKMKYRVMLLASRFAASHRAAQA
jgi:hypothetical protein